MPAPRPPTPRLLLLTGFEPFHTHPSNPSAAAAEALDGLILDRHTRLHSVLLPVEPRAAAARLRPLLDRLDPCAVLLTGLAAGRPQVTLERVAVGVMDFAIPDNAGQVFRDQPIISDGPAAYLSTLPLRAIVDAWAAADIPGGISNTAGLYVCNALMYQTLHHLQQTGRAHIPAGFLHLPANPSVALAVPTDRPALPYLPQTEITRAVEVAARVLALPSRADGLAPQSLQRSVSSEW